MHSFEGDRVKIQAIPLRLILRFKLIENVKNHKSKKPEKFLTADQ